MNAAEKNFASVTREEALARAAAFSRSSGITAAA